MDIRYRVTRHEPGHDLDEPVYFETEEAAMKVALGMSQPEALSTYPGDTITVERVTSEVICEMRRPP